MGKHYDHCSPQLQKWAQAQPMFWVASAPRHGIHVNVSPKGAQNSTFTIFDAHSCAYIDMTGSGAETISHIYENGRVTLCWCSFDTTPRILRFYCWGRVIEHSSQGFAVMLKRMGLERVNGARAVIYLDIFKVGTSCGMSVPLLEVPQSEEDEKVNDASLPMATTAARHFKERMSLQRWAGNMEGKDAMTEYRQRKNTTSLDGLPSIRVHRREKGFSAAVDELRVVWASAVKETRGVVLGVFLTLMILLMMQSMKPSNIEAVLDALRAGATKLTTRT